MRLLFEMDKKDYEYCTHRFVRNSARSIIIRDGKIAMIHSLKYDYYKFPGGGIENGENPVEAMIRETREEAGLVVKPDTAMSTGFSGATWIPPNALFRIITTICAKRSRKQFGRIWTLTRRRKPIHWNMLRP